MSTSLDRRDFLTTTAVGLSVSLASGVSGAANPSEKILVGVMGTGGRGIALATMFARQANVEVAYVCDPDAKRVTQAATEVEKVAGKAPKAVADFRRILDDKSVTVLVCAACNHWHAPATIAACAAGKHVYVEKPCSHNPQEGEWMVAAARKYQRKVQMGNQRRSRPKIQEAIQALRDGIIGRVYHAEAWYSSNRPSIGRGQAVAPPEGLDYDLWQGPAPRKAFRSNYLHYNWHWFWHWGNGELGNNGVHTIDICRWGLGVDYPVRVTSAGGRYRFDDDQETPDTHAVCFEFADRKIIQWNGFSCSQAIAVPAGGIEEVFRGEKGGLAITGTGYIVYDEKGKEIRRETGPARDTDHIANFLNAIRDNQPLNSEIEEGHKSTLLCHLGNIAHRVGRTLKCDPKDGKILHDPEAMTLWRREYEKGWEPKV